MLRKISFTLSLIAMLVSTSCQPSIPEELPDLGEEIDVSQLNTVLMVSAPEEENTFRFGDALTLVVENLSDSSWEFDVNKDIKIFRVENNEWQKVPDKMVNLGKTDLVFAPKGIFPGDLHIIGVNPDIESDHTLHLRVFIIAHYQNLENLKPIAVGSYIDVSLSP
jgi:hypothetical protein